MKKITLLFAAIAAVLSFVSCKNQDRKPLLPSISGKAGEVLIVINKEYWEDQYNTRGIHRYFPDTQEHSDSKHRQRSDKSGCDVP